MVESDNERLCDFFGPLIEEGNLADESSRVAWLLLGTLQVPSNSVADILDLVRATVADLRACVRVLPSGRDGIIEGCAWGN